MRKGGYVYILTNDYHTTLYTGVTSDLSRRVTQHRDGTGSRFTKKYHVHKLVYFEEWEDIRGAIEREKQIKAGSRRKKVELIMSVNPEWRDLTDDIR